jgi:hypothetical protein
MTDPLAEARARLETTIAELRELLAKATPGPWRVSDDNSCTDWSTDDHALVVTDDEDEEITSQLLGVYERSSVDPHAPSARKAAANAALIVALVNAAPTLLSALDPRQPTDEDVERMVRAFREALREPGDLPIEGPHGWTPEWREKQIKAMRAALSQQDTVT